MIVIPRQTAEKIVQDVFYGRSGFDHWWDGVDEDIQDEIVWEIAEKIKEIL